MVICIILLVISLLANLYLIREYIDRPTGPAFFPWNADARRGDYLQIAMERQRRMETLHRSLQRSTQSLRDRLKYRLQQQHGSPGKIIDQVFDEWLSSWDNEWGES